VSDKCDHNDHDHILVWVVLFIIGTGGCPTATSYKTYNLEKRVQTLENQRVNAEEPKQLQGP
jgi:hypothetical protein